VVGVVQGREERGGGSLPGRPVHHCLSHLRSSHLLSTRPGTFFLMWFAFLFFFLFISFLLPALFSSTQPSSRYISFPCVLLFYSFSFSLFSPFHCLPHLRSSHLLGPPPGTSLSHVVHFSLLSSFLFFFLFISFLLPALFSCTQPSSRHISFPCGSLFNSFFFSLLLSFYLLSPSCTLLIYSALVQVHLFSMWFAFLFFLLFCSLLSFYLLSPSSALLIYSALVQVHSFSCGSVFSFFFFSSLFSLVFLHFSPFLFSLYYPPSTEFLVTFLFF
jgi:hypothetical protein